MSDNKPQVVKVPYETELARVEREMSDNIIMLRQRVAKLEEFIHVLITTGLSFSQNTIERYNRIILNKGG